MKISYDPKCEELARWMLDDEYGRNYDRALVGRLAGVIQQAIEEWLANRPAFAEADEGEDESGQGEGK